jgi:F420-dependent oxidoreductase-like protein
MRISLNMANHSWPEDVRGELSRIVRAADESGPDTVWVADHLLQVDPTSSPEAAILEAYTTLGFLAAQTERVRLGAMVTPVTYRPPAVLIKALTTLDVLSAGRAWLGVGSGYSDEEARAMGVPLPPVAERFERLEETLRLATQMWAGDASEFTGHHYHLERPQGSPLPLTRPHPPILIGGMGERKTLRLVARYGDACNLFEIPDGGETVRRKLEVLADHCAAESRAVRGHREDAERAPRARRVGRVLRRPLPQLRGSRNRARGHDHARAVKRAGRRNARRGRTSAPVDGPTSLPSTPRASRVPCAS